MATDGPPSSAFSRPTSTIVSPSNVSPSNDDLNSRWRHEDYETGKKGTTSTTNKSTLIIPAMDEENNNNSKNNNNTKDGEYNNYKLYETPEKLERSSSTASSSRSSLAGRKLYSTTSGTANLSNPVDNSRRTYSFNRSSSYDTDALIRKYGGISGIPATMPSAAPPVLGSSSSSHSSSSSLSKSVREEAMKVLEIKDSNAVESADVNQPFNVRRTESGGFRCNAIPMDEAGDHEIAPDAIQPYYATKQKQKGPRTPSALAGLGLSERGSSQRNASSSSAASWKSARMSFSDPKFREDDHLDQEEEEEENFDIAGPAGGDPENEGVELSARNNIMSNSSYRDHPQQDGGGGSPTGSSFDDVEFDGDYPRSGGSSGLHPPSSTGGTGSSSWSSRYSDNPRMSNTNLLDRWDQKSTAGAATSPEKRQSARNMFMSTASSMRAAAGTVSKSVSSAAADGGKKFGKGFSFKKSSSFRMNDIKEAAAARERDEANNLRTVWKNDDTFQDEHSNVSSSSAARSPPRKGGETCGSRVRNALSCANSSNHGDRKHKSWEDVVHEKKRRRTILLAIICALLGIIIISVSVTETRDTWKTKHVFDGSDKGMEVIFYATSNTDGSATNSGTSPQQLEQDLHTIPVDAEFLTHLGNLQDASLTQCPANRNEEVASILRRSPVPVFLVPGEHDWLHCPNQNYAYTRWLEAFSQFTETAFVDTLAMEVLRPKTTPEVFATLHNGVLLLGLHVVSGSLQGVGQQTSGDQELIMKDEKMKIFVRGTLEELRGQFRAIVLLGNARPSQQQYSFFTGIAPALRDAKTPVLYLHSDSNGAGTTEHYPFHFAAPTTPAASASTAAAMGRSSGTDNEEKEDKQQQKQDREIQEYLQQILAVQVPNGGMGQAPVRITIGFGKAPFHIG